MWLDHGLSPAIRQESCKFSHTLVSVLCVSNEVAVVSHLFLDISHSAMFWCSFASLHFHSSLVPLHRENVCECFSSDDMKQIECRCHIRLCDAKVQAEIEEKNWNMLSWQMKNRLKLCSERTKKKLYMIHLSCIQLGVRSTLFIFVTR